MDNWLLKKTTSLRNGLPVLTTKKIRLIEDSIILTLPEKKELLLMLLGYKFTIELKFSEKKEKTELLLKLGLPFHVESRIHSKKGKIKWLQVSANERIDRFVNKYATSMSSMEAGLLYGYPFSAVLAFMDLIPRTDKVSSDNFYNYWFGMVRSKHLFEMEESYFKNITDKLAGVSPKIYSELQQYYARKIQSISPAKK
ncbi:MAG: hypothetical protein WC805_01305 [Patescibacteria group bacterium]|jgi:hypothetical protein